MGEGIRCESSPEMREQIKFESFPDVGEGA